MISMGSGTLELELTDPAIESADVIIRFIAMTRSGKLEMDTWKLKDLGHLALFLKKYDCPAAIELLFAHVKGSPAGSIKSFILGAVLDDIERCVTALETPLDVWQNYDSRSHLPILPPIMPLRKWSKTRAEDANTRHPEGCVFETYTLPLEWTALLPPAYRWALDQAWRERYEPDVSQMFGLGPSFKELLKLAQGRSWQQRRMLGFAEPQRPTTA